MQRDDSRRPLPTCRWTCFFVCVFQFPGDGNWYPWTTSNGIMSYHGTDQQPPALSLSKGGQRIGSLPRLADSLQLELVPLFTHRPCSVSMYVYTLAQRGAGCRPLLVSPGMWWLAVSRAPMFNATWLNYGSEKKTLNRHECSFWYEPVCSMSHASSCLSLRAALGCRDRRI